MTIQPYSEAEAKRWRSLRVDNTTVAARCARVCKRSIKTDSKVRLLKLALNMVDLTTLEGMDSAGKVEALCRKAMNPHGEFSDLPSVAAVCVYPNMVPIARAALGAESSVKLASVATSFPSGLSPLPLKLQEVRDTVAMGADEIDMVINRGAFLSGDWVTVHDEIAATKEACGSARLKVILETGELQTLDNVAAASRLAIHAGADFIKTSTGKESVNATLPVSLVMIRAIRDYYQRTGFRVGYKPAGGISKAKDALIYLSLIKEELGNRWLQPDLFRFGASSLLGDIERQLEHHVTGAYSAAYRHPMG